MKKLAKNTFIYAIGEVIPKLLSFGLLPVYTHYLTPNDYGILSYTNAVMVFLFVFSTLSLNSYVLRFFFEKKSDGERRKLIGNIFLFISFINIIILVLGFVIVPSLLNHFHVKVPWNPYFKLAFIANFLDVFSVIPLVLYRVRQNAKFFVALNLGKVVLQYFIIFILIVVYNKGILGYYYGNIIASIPFFIIYWIIIYRQCTLNLNIKEIQEGLRFSLVLLPGAIAYLLLSFSDRVFLERYVTMRDIGIYNIAYTLAFTLNMVIQSGYKAIEPEIFKRYGSHDFSWFILKSKAVFFFTVYLGAMLLSLFSQEFFQLMTAPAYYNGYLLVPIIMVGVIMTGQNVIFGGILTAEKNTKSIGIATVLGVIVSLTSNIFLIPRFGIYAAAISTAISFGVMNLTMYFKMKLKDKSIKQELIALFSFIIFVIPFYYFFKFQFSILSIFIKVFVFCLYTLVLLKIFKIKFNHLFALLKF